MGAVQQSTRFRTIPVLFVAALILAVVAACSTETTTSSTPADITATATVAVISDPQGTSDTDGDGVTLAGDDCDDLDSAVHPGATEVTGRIDNDCDGRIDNDPEVLSELSASVETRSP